MQASRVKEPAAPIPASLPETIPAWEDLQKWLVFLRRTDLRRVYFVDHASWPLLHGVIGQKEIPNDVELCFFTETGAEMKECTGRFNNFEVFPPDYIYSMNFPPGVSVMIIPFVLSSVLQRTSNSVSIYVLSNELEFGEFVNQVIKVHPQRKIFYRNAADFNIDTITSPHVIAEPVGLKIEEKSYQIEFTFILENLEPGVYPLEDLVRVISSISGYEDFHRREIYKIIDDALEKGLAKMEGSSIIIARKSASVAPSSNKRPMTFETVEESERKVQFHATNRQYHSLSSQPSTVKGNPVLPQERERRVSGSDPESFYNHIYGDVNYSTSIPVLNMLIQSLPNAPRAPFTSTFVDRRSGPDHCPTFESHFFLTTFPQLSGVKFVGVGSNKKESQKKAALLACLDLHKLGLL